MCVHTCSFIIYNGHYYSRYDSMHAQMCMHTLQLQESRSINSQPCKVSAGRGAGRRWRESVITVRSCWYLVRTVGQSTSLHTVKCLQNKMEYDLIVKCL